MERHRTSRRWKVMDYNGSVPVSWAHPGKSLGLVIEQSHRKQWFMLTGLPGLEEAKMLRGKTPKEAMAEAEAIVENHLSKLQRELHPRRRPQRVRK